MTGIELVDRNGLLVAFAILVPLAIGTLAFHVWRDRREFSLGHFAEEPGASVEREVDENAGIALAEVQVAIASSLALPAFDTIEFYQNADQCSASPGA